MKRAITLCTVFISVFCHNAISQITVENGQIAPDFPTFKGTLLVLNNSDFRDNTLNRMTEKRFEKHYKGNYEIIEEEDLQRKQYGNINKYRFTVQLQNSRTISSGGTQRGSANDETKFVMTDRATGKKYETRTYTNWVTAMNQYPEALEKARSK